MYSLLGCCSFSVNDRTMLRQQITNKGMDLLLLLLSYFCAVLVIYLQVQVLTVRYQVS